ncbi:hypothetical protein FDZ74_02155 [bacterium]|nr:MAG: hypothetical protein FDZ74_02155 [bacterium]
MVKERGSRWPIKVLSLLLAVFLWMYVTNELNPTKEQVLRQIPVETRGLGAGLAVLNMSRQVTLRVQGNQNVMADLAARSVEVSVDLSGVKAGKSRLPVSVKLPPGVRLVDVTPDEIMVEIDRLAEKHVHIKPEVTSRPAEGYRQMKAVVKPSQVVLKGPQKVLAGIDAALARVDLRDRTVNVLETVPVQLLDKQGKVVEKPGVDIVPAQVEVFVPIVVELPSRTVPVKVPVTGVPAEGLEVTAVIPEPKTVTVTGRWEVLAGIREITAEAVDITGVKEDVLRAVRLRLPAGVTSPATPEVRVLIRVGPVTGQPQAPGPGTQAPPQEDRDTAPGGA